MEGSVYFDEYALPRHFRAGVVVEVQRVELAKDEWPARIEANPVMCKEAAIFGARYAVSRLPRDVVGQGLAIRIVEVMGIIGSTSDALVAMIAAQALAKALDIALPEPPQLDKATGAITFAW